MGDKTRGIIPGKFDVIRTDGESEQGRKHDDCPYFVLDLKHDPFSFAALDAYARACEKEYPLLAKDIRDALLNRTMGHPLVLRNANGERA
jgi:hypothetical protein